MCSIRLVNGDGRVLDGLRVCPTYLQVSGIWYCIYQMLELILAQRRQS